MRASPTASPAADQRLVVALLGLTFSTGLIDAVSVLGLGQVFTANMTGNVVFLGFAAAGAPHFDVVRSGVALAAFLVGAVAGGALATRLAPAARGRWVATAVVVEAACLLAAAGFAVGYDRARLAPATQLHGMLVSCAFAMGLRNATVRRLALPDLTTTVLTLTLTGLGADARIAGGSAPRTGRRIAAVLLMVAGAGMGTALLHHGGLVLPLLLSSGLALATGWLAHTSDRLPAPAPDLLATAR